MDLSFVTISNILTTAGVIVLLVALAINFSTTTALLKSSNQYTLGHISAVNDSLHMAVALLGIALMYFGQSMHSDGIKIILLIIFVFIFLPLSAYTLPKVFFFKEKVLCENKKHHVASKNK